MATTFVYNKAGNVTSITETPAVGAVRTTSFTYDKEQQPLTATLPSGTVLTYAYDTAHQLASVTDNLGNKVAYAYDLKGNRTQTVVKDAGGTIQRQVDYVFNARNFVASINAAGAITQVITDAVGNPTTITDPNGHATANTFDALDRVAQIVDRLGGAVALDYDAQGHLADLTSPNGARTTYVANGLGDQTQESSADRGAVQRTFDAAGNMLTRMDARGITASSTYDALNRPTSLTYPAAGEDVAYTWDTCANGKGRLCGVTDATGTWAYAYDGFGRVASLTWTTQGRAYTTGYAWNPDDTLASVTYPSGRQVSYTRNSLGQITAIATTGQNIVSGRTYRADGLLKGQTYGNGLADARAYDTQGRLTSWTTGSVDSRSYGYDANGNVVAIGASTFGYDWLDRLTAAPGQAFAYDPNGNRTADSSGAWSYASYSNRLAASPAGTASLDAAGNTLSDRGGNRTFAYNQGGRLVSATVGGFLAGQYSYAFDGHRASKTAGGTTTVFHYDLDGRLIAETDPSGTTLKEYVWDDDGRPLAQIATSTITYLHPDYLGTPRFGTDGARNIVWQWGDLSFGTGPPMGNVTVNLRFAGQYADAETALFQNWYRTYDPAGGRYLESDPIGLFGGYNSFRYGNANPLRFNDPSGQIVETLWDAANISLGVTSLASNVAAGNITGAVVDAAGITLDVIATAIPGVPGGAGTAIKAARTCSIKGTGAYKDVLGHHVHAKKAFDGTLGYDLRNAYSVSIETLNRYGVRHADITAAQQRMFRTLDASGAANTLTQHSRIAYQSLVQAGMPSDVAKQLVIESQSRLIRAGVVEPARIPWGAR